MANVKITELTALNAAETAATDVFPIVDVDADATKKISVSDLLRSAPDGTLSAPGFAFANDSNSGLYRIGTDNIALVTNGAARILIDANGDVTIPNNLTIQGATTYAFAAGTAAAPSITFVNDSDTGLYRPAANEIGLVTAGTDRVRIDSSGRLLVGGTSTADNDHANINASGTLTIRRAAASDDCIILKEGSTTSLLMEAAGNVYNYNVGSFAFTSWDNEFGVSGPFASLGSFSGEARITAGSTASDDVPLVFRTADGGTEAERARITSDGKLGLGTSSPSKIFDLQSTDALAIRFFNSTTFKAGLEVATNAGQMVTTSTVDDFCIRSNKNILFGIANGEEALRIDTSGNVGIGTTNPGAALQVDASTAFGAVRLNNTGGGTVVDLGVTSGGDLAIRTGSSESVRIDSDGRLLIGTSSALDKLGGTRSPRFQVEGTSQSDSSISITRWNTGNTASPVLYFGGTNSATSGTYTLVNEDEVLGRISFEGTDGSKFVPAAEIEAFVDGTPGANDMPGRLVFLTTADGASSPTERLCIDSSGRVGIGTTSPSALLDVAASVPEIRLTDVGGGAFHSLSGTGNGTLKISADNDNGGANASNITFFVDGTERSRIDSSGRVGIGITSPVALLEVKGVSNITGTPFDYLYSTSGGIRITGNESSVDICSTDVGSHGGSIVLRGVNKGFALINNPDNDVLDLKSFTANADAFSVHGTAGNNLSAHVNIGSITKTGNVGIGTSSPGRKLEVNSGSEDVVINAVSTDSGAYISFEDNSTTNDTYVRIGAVGNDLRFDAGNSERMRIDTSGNVGIGTSSPSSNLHIASSLATIRLEDSDVANGAAYSLITSSSNGNIEFLADPDNARSSSDIRFHVDGSERMRIDSSGRLGVGTSTPNAILDVQDLNPQIQLTDSNNTAAYSRILATDGGSLILDADKGNAGTNSALIFRVDDTERARIDSSGNVGIGTSSPNSTGDKTLHINGASYPTIHLTNGTTGTATTDGVDIGLNHTSMDLFIRNRESADIAFYTSATERMRIDSSGNVGIGTTSPDGKVHAVTTGNNIGFVHEGPSDANIQTYIHDTSNYARLGVDGGGQGDGADGSPDHYLISYGTGHALVGQFAIKNSTTGGSLGFYTGSERMRIDSSGNVGIGTTNPTNQLEVGGEGIIRIRTSQDNTNANLYFNHKVTGSSFYRSDIAATDNGIAFKTTTAINAGPSERIRIDGSGRLLIGTTATDATLSSKFQLVGSGVNSSPVFYRTENNNVGPRIYLAKSRGAYSAKTIVQDDDDLGQIQFRGADGSADLVAASISTFVDGTPGTDDMPGRLVFSTTADGGSSATERMRIDSDGRVLIGGTSTADDDHANITANGTLTVRRSSAGDDCIVIREGATVSLLVEADGRVSSYNVGSNAYIAYDNELGTSGPYAALGAFGGEARITAGSSGSDNVPLVFRTASSGTETERMQIRGDGSSNFFTDHTNVVISRSGQSASTSHSIYVGVRSATSTLNGTVVYRVYTNGTYATISDANQKKNIQTTRDGYLEDINKLRVVKYNWNEQDDTEPKELGLIAQEVEEVFPGLVTNISESSDQPESKGIKSSVLPYMLLKALQEATARIETLEAKVAALSA